MRKIRAAELVGKTIKKIENNSINVLKLHFTDDSVVELWAEDMIHTHFGNIPGIVVADERPSVAAK